MIGRLTVLLVLLSWTTCFAHICPLKFWSNVPYRVEFHAGSAKGPLINTHDPIKSGYRWLSSNQVCLESKRIVAVIFSKDGKKHQLITRAKINNIDRLTALMYPKDFKPYNPLFG